MLGTALGCFAGAFDARADDAHPIVLEDVVVQTTGKTTAPMQLAPSVGKTGTKLEDLPQSITIIPQQVVKEQGGTDLKAAIRDVSGVSQGGGDGFGFGDRLLIRGLNPQVYNDGFSDGDQRNNISHSLNGVQSIEVLKGPGSALLGSGPPGGSINIVHYQPSPILAYGAGVQFGSFDALSSHFYITGPTTTVPGLNYRVDALVEHSDGFRNLRSADYEFRPEFSWSHEDHFVTFSVDARHIEHKADAAGLIYFQGAPIKVSRTTNYSSPFGFANQDYIRTALADVWTATDYVTVTNRFSYVHRSDDILRNGDGSVVVGTTDTKRQLRQQVDTLDDFDYQLEPIWTFRTGDVKHTLLTGFEARRQMLFANRSTADLPNIANVFAPNVPEASVNGLNFLSDTTHSGFKDQLDATYLSAYAADQIDVTDKFKVRLSGREDWWDTSLTPEEFVPGRVFQNNQLIEPGTTYRRIDTPFSWSAGALYKVLPGVSPFVGVARSYLANFNSEATQAGIHDPESAMQYEAGVKFAALEDRLTLTIAGFNVQRNNVFTLVGDTGVFNAQKTRGIEADFQVAVTPDWKVVANVTDQAASLTDNPSAPTAVGKQPIGVPLHIVNIWSTYDFAIEGLTGFKVGGGMQYRDKIFGDQLNTETVPAYTIFDAVLSYAQPTWDASIGIKNITDKLYFTNANGAGAFVGEPRTVYAKADVHF